MKRLRTQASPITGSSVSAGITYDPIELIEIPERRIVQRIDAIVLPDAHRKKACR